jgi:LysM repeat protein
MFLNRLTLTTQRLGLWLGLMGCAALWFLSASLIQPSGPRVVWATSVLGQHVVRAGETLFCIGRAYGVQPARIAEANGLPLNVWLLPGQSLAIPDAPWGSVPPGPVCAAQFTSPYAGGSATVPTATPAPSSSRLGQHIVQRGETLFCIGRAYGVWPTAIAQANRLVFPFRITPGQVLDIPSVQWVVIPPGPVCAAQFLSPFVSGITPVVVSPPVSGGGAIPTLPLITDTPVAGATKTPVPTRTVAPKTPTP